MAGGQPERGAPQRRPPRSAGNLLRRSLAVGAADDEVELEADRIAADVTRRLAAAPSDDSRIRRQAQPVRPVGPQGGAADEGVSSRIRAAQGSGRALPADVGGRMEQAFGASFDHVRLHDDAESHALNRSVQARAFTFQSDVFLGDGAPSLSSAAGTSLLAHELTHVLQQTGSARRSRIARVVDDRAGVVRRVTLPANIPDAIQRAKRALAEHKRDRAALMSIVRSGAKSSDRRTRNACEWILDGRTKLYALNATGDRDARIAHLGEDPRQTETWFPKGDGGPGDLKGAIAEYNPLDLDDQTNVTVDTDDGPNTNGWNGEGYIAVMMRGGAMSKASVLETLRHEVQHDADKNREKRNVAVPVAGDAAADAGEMAKKFERYKTEYRAYNYEGSSYMKLSPTRVVTKYGFKWSERQLAIFEGIHEGYGHTQEYWDDSFGANGWKVANPGKAGPDEPSAKGQYHWANITAAWKSSIEARRRALVDYVNPDEEGFNKYDSIRVDDFYKALSAVPVGTSSTEGKPMSTVMWKAAALGKKDARYVLEESPDFRKKLKAQLVDEAYVRVFQLLCGVAEVKKATPLEQLGKAESKTIQTFSDAIDAVPPGTADPKHATVRTLRFKTAKLTKKEAKSVLQHNSKLLNKLEFHLQGQALTELKSLLQACVG